MTLRKRRAVSHTVRYLVALLALLFFLFPIFWIFMTAFKGDDWIYKSPPVWIAPNPTLQHFALFVESGGWKAFSNSLVISGSATLLALLIGSLAAYGLARYKVGGDNLPFFILSQRFMPPVAVIFPFLLIYKTLKWMDTYQALVIVYLTFNLPYVVWMMRGFFLEIPIEIEESRWWMDVRPWERSGASPCPCQHRDWWPPGCSALSSSGPSSSLPSA